MFNNKEIKRLNDKLQEAEKTIKALKADIQRYSDEKRTLKAVVRKEVELELSWDREFANKEVTKYQEKYDALKLQTDLLIANAKNEAMLQIAAILNPTTPAHSG